MRQQMNLALIGYRGTGKTCVGQRVAERLEMPFVDADDRFEILYGTRIADSVAVEGWSGFRAKEQAVLSKICRTGGQVIATGGGAILHPENIWILKRTGQVIWLQASVQTIAKRIHGDDRTGDQRPSLTGKGVLDEIIDVLNARLPLYTCAADACVSTDDLNLDTVAGRVCDVWRHLPEKKNPLL
ncbi:MAG: shikimate kinase [Deltaproteobacteria bacterium]|nr:MAG: shikimate kinase [Deltaproteobacteria bacterium]